MRGNGEGEGEVRQEDGMSWLVMAVVSDLGCKRRRPWRKTNARRTQDEQEAPHATARGANGQATTTRNERGQEVGNRWNSFTFRALRPWRFAPSGGLGRELAVDGVRVCDRGVQRRWVNKDRGTDYTTTLRPEPVGESGLGSTMLVTMRRDAECNKMGERCASGS